MKAAALRAGYWVATMTRYSGVGVLCAILNNAIVILGDFAGLNYFACMLLALFVVTPLAYVLQSVVTFRRSPTWQGFLRFAIGTVMVSPLSIGMMIVLCSWLSVGTAIAMPLTTFALYGWNFLNARWAVQDHGIRRSGN